MNRTRLLFIKSCTVASEHAAWWTEIIDIVFKITNGNHRGTTSQQNVPLRCMDNTIGHDMPGFCLCRMNFGMVFINEGPYKS